MRNDFGTRYSPPRFPYGQGKKKGGSVKKRKKQGYDDRLDESLGARRGKKSQSFKARRDESKGMEKAMGRRAYASVRTMDKGRRKK
jgi:hypothetical protein